MNSNETNRRSGDQPTRKFDAVQTDGGANAGGVPIRERAVYGRRSVGANDDTSRPAAEKRAGEKRASAEKKSAASDRKKSKTKKPRKKKKLTPEQRAQKRRRRGVRFAVMSIIVALAVILSVWIISCICDVLPMYRPTDKISVSVNNAMSTDEVIDILADKGLIKNRAFCKFAAKFLGYEDTEYLTSVYELQPSYGLEKMLTNMSKNAVGSETVKLIFPEGYSMEQIFQKLESFEVCSAASLRATAREMDFSADYPFLKNIPNPESRYYTLEGYLYPDTYEFYVGENATSVIKRFLTNFENHWKDEYTERAAELNMTMDQVVNLASIIEKEAYGTDQMYKISSVLHNRLFNGGSEFAYLQCDSTSSYVSGIPETVLSGEQKVAYARLYDTYQCRGLPAGPICSPGDDAIQAALYPEDTDYYYFRHDVNKKIYLAETKQGHDRNGDIVLRVNAEAAATSDDS